MKRRETEPINRDLVLKFRALLEEGRGKLISTDLTACNSFHLQPHDLLDPNDLASSEFESSMLFRLKRRKALVLKKIDSSLQRIEHGIFGQCLQCGEEIEIKRLEARPTTGVCIRCKEIYEHSDPFCSHGRIASSLSTQLTHLG